MTTRLKKEYRGTNKTGENDELLQLLHQAYREVVTARQAFNAVSDMEAVETIVYQLNAAEANYYRLLRMARSAGLTGHVILR